MIKTHLLFVIALTFLGLTLIYYTTYLNLIVSRIASTRNTLVEYLHSKLGLELTPETLFLYRAYLLNSTTVRVLSINRCVDPEWKLLGIVDGEEVAFTPRTIETNCPWGWAPGCLYSSYVFDASVTNSFADRVTLSRNGSDVVLPLHRPPSRSQGTLSLCVPPIYWFTDWIKLIFFMETWRVHGASHVFVYYHSSTLNVREVLRHYEREGFVTIIAWPLLPSSSDVDPNRSLYRLAHSLAHNDCVLRLNSEFGALVDIDELIVPRNGSLLSLVMQRFSSSPSLGALSFPHRALLLDPPLAGTDFTFKALDFIGISNAEEADVTGPPKYSELRQWICCQRTRSESSMMDSFQRTKSMSLQFFEELPYHSPDRPGHREGAIQAYGIAVCPVVAITHTTPWQDVDCKLVGFLSH